MKKLSFIALCAWLVWSVVACFDIQKGKEFKHVAPGAWRGVFVVDTSSTKYRIPVLFNVNSDEAGKPQQATFTNGNFQIATDSMRFWGDTAYFYFNSNQTYLRVVYEVGFMNGFLFDQTNAQYPIIFQAQHGAFPRFPDIRRQPSRDIDGKWSLELVEELGDSVANHTAAIKIMLGQPNTPTETRTTAILEMPNAPAIELEGESQGSEIYLSGFDGKRAVLFTAALAAPNQFQQGLLLINNKRYVCTAKK